MKYWSIWKSKRRVKGRLWVTSTFRRWLLGNSETDHLVSVRRGRSAMLDFFAYVRSYNIACSWIIWHSTCFLPFFQLTVHLPYPCQPEIHSSFLVCEALVFSTVFIFVGYNFPLPQLSKCHNYSYLTHWGNDNKQGNMHSIKWGKSFAPHTS